MDLYEALFLLGVLVGSIQILIAIFKLGDLTRYISESVILAFWPAPLSCSRSGKSPVRSASTIKAMAICRFCSGSG